MPMPYGRSTNYEMIYVLLAVLVICCLTILGPWVIQPKMQEIRRDLSLQTLETAYKAIQPPAQTEPLAFQAVFWNEAANKKGCNFFVGEIRSYRGEPDEIRAAYAAQHVADASPIQVVFIENGTLPADENSQIPLSLRALQAWALPPGAAEQALYLVYIFKSDQTLSCS